MIGRGLQILSLLASLVLPALALAADPPPTTRPATAPAGVYVAVGYGGRRMSSSDGVHWENHARWSDEAKDNDDVLFNVAFGHGKFIAVGGGAKIGHILSTVDGKEWRELPQQRGRVATVAFGNDRFVAGHGSGFLYSTDGETWKPGAKLDFKGGVYFRKSAFGNGLFVSIGDCDPPGEKRTTFRAVTKDGETVTHFAHHTPAARSIAFGAGRFVVVGPGGLRESSADGQTWENAATEPGADLSSVIWTGQQFLATGEKFSYASPDGATWTKLPKRIAFSLAHGTPSRIIGFSWGGNVYNATGPTEWKKVEVPPGPSFESVTFGSTTTSAGIRSEPTSHPDK